MEKSDYEQLKKEFTFDTFGRYAIIRDIVNVNRQESEKEIRILDVGGRSNVLRKFLTKDNVFYMDPNFDSDDENFIKGDGCNMPLTDGSFDWVVSTDVLEHVNNEKRIEFLKEMIRVAKNGIILAAPFLSESNIKAEKSVNDSYKILSGGEDYVWLAEHKENGLPLEREIEAYLAEHKIEYQKIKHNNLFLWEPLLKMTLSAVNLNMLDELRDFNYFYNTEIFPFDSGENSYRTFYFIKKQINLLDTDFGKKVITEKLLSKSIAVGMDSLIKIMKLNNEKSKQTVHSLDLVLESLKINFTQKDQELTCFKKQISFKDQELTCFKKQISFMESSKFWKIREKYVSFKLSLFAKKYFKKIIDLIKPFISKSLRRRFGYIYDSFFIIRKTSNMGLVDISANISFDKKKVLFDVFNFSVIDWDFRIQRPQHLCMGLAKKENRIFYVATNLIDCGEVGLEFEEIRNKIGIRQIKENIFEIQLVSKNKLNIYKDIISDKEDLLYLQYSIDAIKEKFGFTYSVSIIDLPFWYKLVAVIPNTKIIYDCMDDHAGFENNSEGMLTEENVLIMGADIVLATSDLIAKKIKSTGREVVVVKNAGEVEFFSNLKESDVLGDIKKPIIGYYGAISTWFDYEMVRYCASKKPDWNFVLIGRTCQSGELEELKKQKNVFFLGEKPYADIPKYLYHFNVCMIPFKIIPLTLATNPVKFFEYIGSGKPVVSVELPELKEYKDIAYLAKNKEEFLSSIERALNEDDKKLIGARKEVARKNSWNARVDVLYKEIEKLYPKMSVIIVTYNNLGYTKQCLKSLFEKTSYPNYEVIIIDNNSTDETPGYLKEIEKENINVKVILNSENRGFAGGNNDGLRIAKGEYIVLLNNDTVVTSDWLNDMRRILDSGEKLGLLGPVSNSVGNIQMIPVGYKKIEDMDIWMKKNISRTNPGYYDMQMIGFFCIMMKREVYEKVGDLDENFGIGMFEDDDYCMRIKEAGYRLGYTDNVFVHHFGSVSFKKLEDEKYKAIWEKNKKYFENKWKIKWKPSLDKKNEKKYIQ